MAWVYNDVYNNTMNRDQRLQEERRRLENELRSRKDQLRSAKDDAARKTVKTEKELRALIEQERRRNDRILSELDEKYRLEIGAQNERFRRQMDGLINELNATNANVDQINRRVNRLADECRANWDRVFQAIRDRKQRAQAYRCNFSSALNEIYLMHPDKLTPDEISIMRAALEDIDNDIENEDYEAAISIIHNRLPEMAQLRNRLVILNMEYDQLVESIDERAQTVLARIEEMTNPENNLCQLDENGIKYDPDDPRRRMPREIIDFDGRVSYWSEEMFDGIINDLQNLLALAQGTHKEEMNIEALRASLEELNDFERRLDECTAFAHREFVNSLYVERMSDAIFNTVTYSNEWICDQDASGYENDDRRRTCILEFDNGFGMHAAFVVMPNKMTVERMLNGRETEGDYQFEVQVFGEPLDLADKARDVLLGNLREPLYEVGIEIDRATHWDLSNAANANTRYDPYGFANSTYNSSNADEFVRTVSGKGEELRNDRFRATGSRVLKH